MSREGTWHLARLASRLGIDAERAFTLRDEVESHWARGAATAGRATPRS